MKIIKAGIEHAEELAELFDAYRVFYKKASDKPGAVKFLSERISNNESQIYIALDETGTMTSFVQLFPLFSSTRMKKLWLLNDLFVRPAYRGKGISKALIDRAKMLCIETRACALMLETAKDNAIGNRLYPSVDFELDSDHNYYSWNAE